MTTITTKLIKDGNSMGVRLPKQLLAMSGLHGAVQLEAKRGQIILRASKHPRTGWEEQINHEIKVNGPLSTADEYGDLSKEADSTLQDGLDG